MATPDTPTKYRHPLHSKLWMFRRDRSPFWWTGFHHNGTYHRTSTKTPHRAEAEAFAGDWYFNQQVEIRSGNAPVKSTKRPVHTVKDASILALSDYRTLVQRGDKSNEYLKGIIRVMNKHVLPHFGDMDIANVNAVVWHQFLQQLYEQNPNIANNTVHQIRNALAVCLNAAANNGWIGEAPRLRLKSQTNLPTKRVWFEPDEQELLVHALDDNVKISATTPHKEGSKELRDYALFMLYSGLRIGEANALRFVDIREITDHLGAPHILIDVEQGKRGYGTCNPDSKINKVYQSIKARRQGEELLFKEHHRDMFNTVLKRGGLKFDKNGRKRDFVSLRHTYISNRLRESVPIYDIAANCRTSPAMIERHYAKHLSTELLTSFHSRRDKEVRQTVANIAEKERDMMKAKQRVVERAQELAKILGISIQEVGKRFPEIRAMVKD